MVAFAVFIDNAGDAVSTILAVDAVFTLLAIICVCPLLDTDFYDVAILAIDTIFTGQANLSLFA